MLNIYDKMRVCERCEMLTALCCFVVVIRIVVCFFVCCNKSPCFGQNIGAFLKNQRERKEKRSNIVPRAMSQSKQESFRIKISSCQKSKHKFQNLPVCSMYVPPGSTKNIDEGPITTKLH